MLIYLYLFATIAGGAVVGASLLGGDKSTGDVDSSGGKDLAYTHGDSGGVLLLFLSLRFWSFFLAFFGLTGLVLDGFGLLPSVITLVIALGAGLIAGLGVSWSVRALASTSSNSAVSVADYVGKSAKVLVPVSKASAGKIRLQLKGNTVDLLAFTDEEALSTGEEVLVVEVDGTRARVARLSSGD